MENDTGEKRVKTIIILLIIKQKQKIITKLAKRNTKKVARVI